MIKRLNPDTVAQPASKYAQAVLHAAAAERIVISGQVGVRLDGTVETGLEAQMQQAWLNVFAVLQAAGFEKRHLVKVTVFVTEPGQVAVYRRVRDKLMEGLLVAMTYVQVAGLALPKYLVEIEAEAVKD